MVEAPQPESTWPPPGISRWSLVARRVRVPLGFLFAMAYVWWAHPTQTTLLIGTLVLLPGLLLRALASGHVKKDKQLTTSGPYAYTRNPLYLGSLIMAAGFAIAAHNWWIVAVMLLMFAAIYVPVIAGEEHYLRRTFPDYDEYARSVPRIFPRLTPFDGGRGSFSFARYWKHHEYEATIGCVVMLIILVVKLRLS